MGSGIWYWLRIWGFRGSGFTGFAWVLGFTGLGAVFRIA